VDRFIFTSKILAPQWEVAENIVCADCKKPVFRGYRLVKAKNYDKTLATPEFRCEKCSQIKSEQQKKKGIIS
jgi:DNA-directed RNA polymerase subunit RPC12/RpoP